jgi:hypothetical protein
MPPAQCPRLLVVASDVVESVYVEDTATPEQVQAVNDTFARHGIAVTAFPGYSRKSAGALPWVVHITLAAPIAAFFAAVGSEAGKDTYAAVKAWIKDMWEARRDSGNGEGSMNLEDPERSHLILPTRLPDRALDALAEIVWDEARGDYLVWDDALGQWLDAMRRKRTT